MPLEGNRQPPRQRIFFCLAEAARTTESVLFSVAWGGPASQCLIEIKRIYELIFPLANRVQPQVPFMNTFEMSLRVDAAVLC